MNMMYTNNELSWYEYRKCCKLTLVNIENSNMNMIPTMNCPGMNIVRRKWPWRKFSRGVPILTYELQRNHWLELEFGIFQFSVYFYVSIYKLKHWLEFAGDEMYEGVSLVRYLEFGGNYCQLSLYSDIF